MSSLPSLSLSHCARRARPGQGRMGGGELGYSEVERRGPPDLGRGLGSPAVRVSSSCCRLFLSSSL